MSDQTQKDVAVLKDWRDGHQDEHKEIWRRLEKQGETNLTVAKAIERIETKLVVFTALGVILGNFLASVLSKFFKI